MKNFLFSVACGGIVGTAVLGLCYAGERLCEWLQDKLGEPDEKKNP